MSAHIRVQRAHTVQDRLSTYGVYIDGVKVGKVRDDSEVEFEVTSGQHQVQMRAAFWSRGKAITVNVPEGGSSHLLTSGGPITGAFGLAGAAVAAASSNGQQSVRRLQLVELNAVAAE
ncbi:hypothetical protein KDL01_00270 [Actinospica durhamensis]|uniref:Uncharacterized protein n=1 Tax=Actinospica durhamensis TaxID=1508375 RepID=A0A941IQV1_9ACTN|nr:hypothetical protein [Actinospica durhamensis]MBR7831671.1 hypothetical protein [Actinospica durhamensis]